MSVLKKDNAIHILTFVSIYKENAIIIYFDMFVYIINKCLNTTYLCAVFTSRVLILDKCFTVDYIDICFIFT